MKTDTLGLTRNCSLTATHYDGESVPHVALSYIEHATDHWNSDSETYVDITAQQAVEIIGFLTLAFGSALKEQA